MKQPNLQAVTVPKTKIVDYLLATAHADGASKARWFTSFGFSAESWATLADALREHATE